MTTLLANPGRYDGEIIRTEGVASIGFESDAIWLTREHLQESVMANAISILLPSENPAPWPEFEHLNRKYVYVEGRFHKANPQEVRTGGTITDISLLYSPGEEARSE